MYANNYQYAGQQQMHDTNPSCKQLLAQIPQFSMHWPAPSPQGLNGVPPALNAELPVIANIVGNFIGGVASTNGAYTYYFNVLAINGFRNDHFMDLVEFAARYYVLLMEQRAVASQQEAYMRAAETAVQTLASVTVLKNPALQQLLPPEIWHACLELASKYQNIMNQFARGVPQQQTQQGYSGYANPVANQNQGFGMGPGYAQNQGGYAPRGVVVEQFQPVNTHQVTPEGNIYVDPNRSRRSLRIDPSMVDVEPKKFFNIPGATTQEEKPQVVTPSAGKVTHMSPGAGMTTSEVNYRVVNSNMPVNITWAPHKHQAYQPAFDKHEQAMVVESHRLEGSNEIINVAIIKELENPNMNRADHAITTAQSIYRGMNHTEEPRVQKVANDLDLAARAMNAMASQEDDETTQKLRNLQLVETDAEYLGEDSLISFVTTARVRRLQTQVTEGLTAFTVTGSIVTNFATPRSLAEELFMELALCRTFDGVEQTLRDFMKKHQIELASALAWRVDRFLRRELLHVIRKRMGAVPFNFDSFIDDQTEVIEALEKDFGPAYSKALLKYQHRFISALFGESNVRFADDGAPLVSSEPRCTVTLLDIDRENFGVQITDDISHEVFPTNFPGLHEFIVAVVKNNPEALHHYIVTEDDFVYEVHKSVIGDDVYLISNGPTLVQDV